jgi:hypothetical protein
MKPLDSLPEEISAAVDRIAIKRARGDTDPDALLYARLEVLSELEKEKALRQAQREVVDALRKAPDKNTWAKIADSMGASLGAVWGRFGSSGSTTPESRREQVAQYAGRVTPDIGMSVTEAMRETGTYRATIYDHIERSPGASWYERVETTGKRGAVYRIVDLNGLKESLSGTAERPGRIEGLTLAEAEASTGIDRSVIRACMSAEPEAPWFTQEKPAGGQRAVTRITEVDGLRDAAKRVGRRGSTEPARERKTKS